MATARHRLWRWNVSIWVHWLFLRRFLHLLATVATYPAANALESAFSCLLLLHEHSVVISASWDDHGGKGIATVDALVVHDVLRIVLAAHKVSGKFETVL